MTTTQPKGSPSSAQPMPGLSKRAQKLLKPRPYLSTPIEPAGSALARWAKTKASI